MHWLIENELDRWWNYHVYFFTCWRIHFIKVRYTQRKDPPFLKKEFEEMALFIQFLRIGAENNLEFWTWNHIHTFLAIWFYFGSFFLIWYYFNLKKFRENFEARIYARKSKHSHKMTNEFLPLLTSKFYISLIFQGKGGMKPQMKFDKSETDYIEY